MQEADRLVAAEKVEQGAYCLATLAGEIGVVLDQVGRIAAGDFQQVGMCLEARDAKAWGSRLARAEQFAFAAQFQVFLSDAKSVFRFTHDRQARMTSFAQWPLVEQDAGRSLVTAPYASAKLVKLRQAEALGMLDHHDRRIGNIDADFHHCCCD